MNLKKIGDQPVFFAIFYVRECVVAEPLCRVTHLFIQCTGYHIDMCFLDTTLNFISHVFPPAIFIFIKIVEMLSKRTSFKI